jgi:CheY-like chemotaxis protein
MGTLNGDELGDDCVNASSRCEYFLAVSGRGESARASNLPWWTRLGQSFEIKEDPGLMARIGPLAGVHVLVVDDDADARELMKLVLLSDGAGVTTCESAWEALQVVHRSVPSVLVSDIVMPRENAFWLIKEIRKLPPARGGTLPALAVTAYSPLFGGQQALAAGFDAFLERPVDRWELCRVVAMLATGGGHTEVQQGRRAG